MSDLAARQRPAAQPQGHWFESDPLWFKKALFYEIHLRGFYDGNADGSGDFRGLTEKAAAGSAHFPGVGEKLACVEGLGGDCIRLLPMFASPLRGGGYVIAAAEHVQP